MKKIIILILAVTSYVFVNAQSKTAAASKEKVGLEVGDVAPEINLPGPDGKSISLASLRGQVVLIDFWASWCGPCRMENPHVVSAYHKYKSAKFPNANGFTIYSVSLDKAKDAWTNAIQKDQLTWPYHVSDLKWWYSDAAKSYGVQGIPTNWLINEKGVIVEKNLRGATLEAALERMKGK